jgi:hypothetical protein
LRLYLAGNFTVTDEIENEIALKQVMGEKYHRLCTFFYPKPADVIIQNIKPNIPKKIKINPEELKTKNHKALKLYNIGDSSNDQKENYSEEKNFKNKKSKKTIRIRKKRNR